MSYIFDVDRAITTIQRFIAGKLLKSGMNGYVVGLSGGLDSSLAATLAVRAVGKDKVLGVMMPYLTSSPDSLAHATELSEQLGMASRTVDITPMIDAYYAEITPQNRLRAGNKMARERMSILFDLAHETSCLVLGTGNRTEICLGYTTWYGDAACSVNPIGDLYKTEVRLLARKLDLPDPIITKTPSADLWVGQSDEGEIGVSYESTDGILRRLMEGNVRSLSALEREGFDRLDISRIVSLLNRHSFKRKLPDIAPLGKAPIPDEIEIEE